MSDGKKQQENRSDSIKQRRFHVLPPEISGGTVSPSLHHGQSGNYSGPEVRLSDVAPNGRMPGKLGELIMSM